ncbi:hypothetical protein AKJ51_01825 [candidate division MSBL1 archaeon SCGC-AAA382A20]|uniref:PKD domain-containing protein n=1 Tax=candidate division MSBL1 archaeon SCGC-AAA382A20 TaxID=1698280 RepID=A0A133VL97_9EURY|nr:hypothetical protein AKJ51_01825 [candidate division MSBL1 archaeon SCGC-AAA382A20]
MKNRYVIGLVLVVLSGIGMSTVWGTSSSGVDMSVSQEAGVDVVKLNDASLSLPTPPSDRVKVTVENDIWKVVPPAGYENTVVNISYHSGDWLINRPLFKFSLSGGGVDTEAYLSPSIGERTLSVRPEDTFYVTLDNVSWSLRPSTEPVPVTLVLSAGQSSETATITLPPYQNEPPAADFSHTPSSPTAGDAVQFTDESSDPDGTITSRFWDFGDGSTGSGENPVHTYSSPGTYTVTLEVSDDDGTTDAESKEITVTAEANEPPVADADGPYTVGEGKSVELDGTGSHDPDGSITDYSWEVTSGPGSLQDATTAKPTYVAPEDVDSDTEATVDLTVTDDDGATDTGSATITLEEGDPGPPGEKAYDDADDDLVYDDGETTYSESELYHFDKDVNLVIPSDVGGGSISSSEISIKADKITSRVDMRATDDKGKGVELKANNNGPINITGASIESGTDVKLHEASSAILDDTDITAGNKVEVKGENISATNASITANTKNVILDAKGSGPINASGIHIDSGEGVYFQNVNGNLHIDDSETRGAKITASDKIETNFASDSWTLYCDGVEIYDSDDTLIYSPSGVTVVGSPEHGSVSS